MIDYTKLSKSALIALLEQQQDEVLYLKNVLDHLPGSIYWKNKEGVYLGHNAFASNTMKIMGYDWQGIIGKSDEDLFSKEMADEFRQNDLLVMNDEHEVIIEERSTMANGDVVVQLSTKKPLYDKNGTVVGVIGNTVNITRLKEIEVELKEAKESAEMANHIKSQIIHNMEHDIRTPFAGILAMSNLLRARENDPEKKEKLASIAECAQELLDYCNELLEVVNLESGQLSQQPVLFNVRDLIENLLKAERPAAMIRGLRVVFDCEQGVPHYLLGDRVRLYRVLLNLLSNAIKFTKRGQVTVRVRLVSAAADNQVELSFEVQDTGIGIPADKQDFIFEKFARITPSNHGIYKGTGLGLSFVKQFINEMKGTIKVDSELGVGTCFRCRLPFYIASQEANVRVEEQHPVQLATDDKFTILLIEDHIISQKVTKQLFMDCFCEVDTADNGRDAIAYAKNRRYDLILVDIGLPDMDGFTVVETIRRHEKAAAYSHLTPIAILTAHSSHTYRSRASELSIDTFVVKPLTSAIAQELLSDISSKFCNLDNIPSKRKATVDGISFYYHHDQDIRRFHEIFHAGYYHFHADNAHPVIVDAKANIGLSALYFKILYPQANIICFEPHSENFQLLKTNLRAHRLQSAKLINKSFNDSLLVNDAPNAIGMALTDNEVLRPGVDCFSHEVDLLKLEFAADEDNIILQLRDRLLRVKQLMITYYVSQQQQHDNALDDLKKSLIPYFKQIKVVLNPNVIQSRQQGLADLQCPEQACYLIYASNQVSSQQVLVKKKRPA